MLREVEAGAEEGLIHFFYFLFLGGSRDRAANWSFFYPGDGRQKGRGRWGRGYKLRLSAEAEREVGRGRPGGRGGGEEGVTHVGSSKQSIQVVTAGKTAEVEAGRTRVPAGSTGRKECRVFQAGRGRNAKGQGNAPRNARGAHVRDPPPHPPRLAWHFHLLLSRRRHARTAARTPDDRNTITSCGDRPVRQTGAWHQPDDAGDISAAVTPR